MSNPAYLPTEIVVYIAQAIYEEFDDLKPRRLSQSTLYNCCLVSRQWYSAAVAFLYKRPLLTRGGSFAQFTKTVCPPYAARKKVKVDLGSLVQWLDLSHLVHESTPSVMGRLLNRTQSGLRVFIAPTTSFSTNSLSALSKCVKLHHLDLSMVKHPRFDFAILKKAISHLRELSVLHLPQNVRITTTDESAGGWPPKLHTLNISGGLDPMPLPTFSWPPAVVNLTFQNCFNLSAGHLELFLQNPQLQSIQHLEIHPSSGHFLDDDFTNILWSLPNLTFFECPIDVIEYVELIPIQVDLPQLPLKVLELTASVRADDLNLVQYVVEELSDGLHFNLTKLCAFGMSASYIDYMEERERSGIDKVLWEHIDEESDEYLDGLDDIGLYVIDK